MENFLEEEKLFIGDLTPEKKEEEDVSKDILSLIKEALLIEKEIFLYV